VAKPSKQNPSAKQIREHQYRQSQRPSPLVQMLIARDREVHDGAKTGR
jgi:hypothetical protein